jgi:hypothetical protein
MIYESLHFLSEHANAFIRKLVANPDAFEHFVKLVPMTSTDNTTKNNIWLSLVTMEEEKILRAQSPTIRQVGTQHSYLAPELKVNLYVIFTANLSSYSESLKNISLIVRAFQMQSVFHQQQYPLLAASGIEQLSVEFYSPNFEQLNQIWATLGGKYQPSVMYKVRMLIFQEQDIREQVPAILGVSHDFNT